MSFREEKWGAVFVVACAFTVVACSLWTADPDVFWHLKVGEWIVQNRAVPRVDFYSWSASGQPWTCHQWLWEVLIYLLHARFGIAGLWAPVFACALAAGMLLRAGLRASGMAESAASAFAGLGVVLLGGWWKPWPQAGTYALFAAYLYFSSRGRWNRRDLAVIFLLAVLWANIHSNATILPCVLLAEVVYRRVFEGRDVKRLLLAAVLAFAGTLFNPHGFGLWIYAVREGLLSQAYRNHIAEWMPYFFAPEMALPFFACAVIILAAAAHRKWSFLEFARSCGFWVFALLSRIWTPWAVLSTATLAGALGLRVRERFVAALAAAVFLAGTVILVANGIPADLDQAAEKNRYPVRAVEFLKGWQFERSFNDHGFGGYLIWKGVPVYIDGRNDLYWYKDIFLRHVRAPQEWQGKLSDYVGNTGADAALVYRSGPFDRALEESSEWRRVYADGAAAVYVRED